MAINHKLITMKTQAKILDAENTKFARKCDECGCGMNDGFVVDGGCEYYCSEECLHEHYTEAEWEDMYNEGDGDSYWTDWMDDQSDWEYIVKNGKLVEIE